LSVASGFYPPYLESKSVATSPALLESSTHFGLLFLSRGGSFFNGVHQTIGGGSLVKGADCPVKGGEFWSILLPPIFTGRKLRLSGSQFKAYLFIEATVSIPLSLQLGWFNCELASTSTIHAGRFKKSVARKKSYHIMILPILCNSCVSMCFLAQLFCFSFI